MDDRDDEKEITRKSSHKKFLELTKDLEARPIIQKLMKEMAPCEVLELGSGSGRDTVCMLENGCHVTAVDNDPESREIIGRRTTSDAFSRLDFRQEDFKNLKLNKAKYDLVVGMYSLFFCDQEHFNSFFEEVMSSLKSGGMFVGIFLGPNDDWIKMGKNRTYHSRSEILELLNKFFSFDENKDFEEKQYDQYELDNDKKVITDEKGNPVVKKHWHVYRIIARKK